MMRQTFAGVTAVVLFLLGALLGPGSLLSPSEVAAQSIADYTASPISTTGAVSPNVILVFDASGTVKTKAYPNPWDQTLSYFGLFDPLKCYAYNAGSTRFEESATAKGAGTPPVAGLCASTDWDGNFLNWLTILRFDTQKIAATGGNCIGGRNIDGTCKLTGSPAKKTVTAGGGGGGPIPTGAGVNRLGGRVPNTVQGAAVSLSFSGSGTPGGMDASIKASTGSTFLTRLGVDYEPTGVIQDVGSRARFGLMFFSNSGTAFTAVPIGSRQTRDFGGTVIETFTTNTAAMLDGMEEVIATGGTPFVETVYNVGRYYAQVPVPSDIPLAFHPVAFSPAVGLGQSGTGSLGPGEIDVLTGSETCPSGYITGACGRDPNFFGSDHDPPWSFPSAVVDCCKNYVVLFSDGAGSGGGGNVPASIPLPLQDYGHAAIHGGVPHDPLYMKEAGYGMSGLAYWMHINDLRQGTIPVINEAGHDLPGFQNVTVYTFFDQGVDLGRNAMLNMAKAGGFEDKNGNNLPDLVSEYDVVNNYTGVAGPDGLPDTFFESENAEDMKDRLTATIQSILRSSASSTSLAVLSTSSTGEGSAYQAYYYPSTVEGLDDVKWTGYAQSLFVDALGNLREDSDGDGKQVYKNDLIVVTRYDATTKQVLVDRYADANEDGKADSTTCSPCGGALKNLVPIWEAGKRLALKDPATRNVLTWVDNDGDGVVDTGEQMDFSTANSANLSTYLRAGAAPFTADNIVNWIRGVQVAGLRDRQLTVDGALNIWKLGDIINSTLTVVGAPKERYDVIYGDSTYTAFFTQYRNRRMVAYAGANDGMLHAFNAGFYHRGDDTSTSSATEHGWFTRTATDNSSGPLLGDELWGFIPYHLLPQLQWLTRADYGHTYYVDLKPKVTDARIFTADADHPNGWGTILIGGMRLGGSCEACPAGNGPAMSVTISGTGCTGSCPRTVKFYSAYFVMDITNPEVNPKLLWVFASASLGLSTSYPSVVRVNPAADAKTSNTNAKWFMVVGSGPTGYAGSSLQLGELFAVDLQTGPVGGSPAGLFPIGDKTKLDKCSSTNNADPCSFVGDVISLDADLDYRADIIYAGNVLCNATSPAPPCNGSGSSGWAGGMYRLTTGATFPFGSSTTPTTWGILASSDRVPTSLLSTFPSSGSTLVGPITAAPTVTQDDSRNFWVFFGAGRLLSSSDKMNTDTQYFFGVKDPVVSNGCTQTSKNDCERKDLINVSSATICSVCASGTNQVTDPNNTGVTSLTGSATTTLQGLVASKNGWYTTLPGSGERALSSPTLLGGIVFFPTFVPVGDVCGGGSGTSSLYALFYLTGSAYKVSVVGTDTVGGNTNVKRSTALGTGVASQVGIHMGAQGTDSATGITSRAKACSQMSSGAVTCIQTQPALGAWSRYLSWINLRL